MMKKPLGFFTFEWFGIHALRGNNKIRLSTSLQNIPQYIEDPPNTEGDRIISYFSSAPLCLSNYLLLNINNIYRLQFSYWLAICINCLNYSILLKKQHQEQEK
jgi:hypothetical protein